MSGILSSLSGFEVARASRLGQAIERLSAENYDVVLLDLSLPDESGLATCTRLANSAPSLPIVVLTGSADETLALQAVREGAQDYLVKGEFDGKVLARVIRYAIERKRLEDDLRQREEFYRLITENISDLVAVLDRDGKRLYNSPSYRNIIGDRAVVLEGTSSFEEIHPDDVERIERIFLETIASGVGQRAEYRMLLSDGSIRHIESQGNVVKDAAGAPARVVVVSRDITERKRQLEAIEQALADLHQTHKQLQAAQQQLVNSEKLEAVSTFAAGIAHEVKNPLQTILLGLDFLKNSAAAGDQTAAMVLGEMDGAARRADAVIRGLVEFAGQRKRDVKEQDLSAIVELAVRSVENELAAHSIQLTRELAPGLPLVQLDLKTMQHVFLNLLSSSIQSMPNGGNLRVRTYRDVLAKDQNWSGRTPGRLKIGDGIVAAEIEDDGSGVMESKLDSREHRAYETDLIRKGVVDLTVLKKVVELYGGTIQITNRPQGGVKVVIMFKTRQRE